MTTARKPNSTSPATAAAKKAAAAKEAAELEAAKLEAQRMFQVELGAPVLDEDGYEIIPDKAAEPGGTYKFKISGEPFQLPNLQYLPINIAQQLPKLGDQQGLELVLNRYAPRLLEFATPDQLAHVSKRWMEHSKGMTLGE